MRRLWLFSVLIYFFRNRQGLVPSFDFRLVDAHTRTERLASLRFSFCALRFPHEGQDRSVDFVMNPGSRISHANFNGNAQRSPAAMIHQRKTRKNVDKRHRLEINKKKLISNWWASFLHLSSAGCIVFGELSAPDEPMINLQTFHFTSPSAARWWCFLCSMLRARAHREPHKKWNFSFHDVTARPMCLTTPHLVRFALVQSACRPSRDDCFLNYVHRCVASSDFGAAGTWPVGFDRPRCCGLLPQARSAMAAPKVNIWLGIRSLDWADRRVSLTRSNVSNVVRARCRFNRFSCWFVRINSS